MIRAVVNSKAVGYHSQNHSTDITLSTHFIDIKYQQDLLAASLLLFSCFSLAVALIACFSLYTRLYRNISGHLCHTPLLTAQSSHEGSY
jgi:hypothetical protein